MKENKKGFTLIELLAVLVVLAILALIAVPIVLNIINQSREKARLRSVEGFAKAVESAVYVYHMDNPNTASVTLTPVLDANNNQTGQWTINGNSNYSVDYSGTKVYNCILSMDNNDVVLTGCTVEGDSVNLYRYNYKDATNNIDEQGAHTYTAN